jgi:hypothetical protein
LSPSLRAKRSNPSRVQGKNGLLRRYAPRNDDVLQTYSAAIWRGAGGGLARSTASCA